MIMVMYHQQFFVNGGLIMRVGVIKHPRRTLAYLLALFLVSSVGFVANSYAADAGTAPASKDASLSKESFNLILPFKDLTVGQGQEATMDAEVVNRTKDPVEVSLTIDGVPKGWDVNFNSRYPSYPIRSVTVAGAGGDQSSTKSTTVERSEEHTSELQSLRHL